MLCCGTLRRQQDWVSNKVLESTKQRSQPVKHKSLFRKAGSKLIEIAREKDPPHRVALGLGLGIFVGLLPIMGIQMAVVTLFALPLRGNLKAAIAGVWISNPITFLPMYWGYYRFGLLFTPNRRIDMGEFTKVVTEAAQWDWSEITLSLQRSIDLGSDILTPLWIGSVILATGLCIPTYFVTYKLVIKYRARRSR